jgi:mannosyltransferase OCH1-like enzyme
MIPKVIHHCWFSLDEQPQIVKDCIASWHEYCPDYEIKLWTAQNFDVNQNLFCKQAFDNKRWASVADYFRAWVLYNHGGIYLDSDVMMKKNFDVFLSDGFFIGFEDLEILEADTMGCEKGHPLASKILESFDGENFVKADGTFNLHIMPGRVTDCVLAQYRIKRFYDHRICLPELKLYPKVVFSPIEYISGKLKKSRKTYSIHLFNGSWLDKTPKEVRFRALRRYKRDFFRVFRKMKIRIFGNG